MSRFSALLLAAGITLGIYAVATSPACYHGDPPCDPGSVLWPQCDPTRVEVARDGGAEQ